MPQLKNQTAKVPAAPVKKARQAETAADRRNLANRLAGWPVRKEN